MGDKQMEFLQKFHILHTHKFSALLNSETCDFYIKTLLFEEKFTFYSCVSVRLLLDYLEIFSPLENLILEFTKCQI